MTQLDKDDYGYLDWHAFLVHTDLCTMNYDRLRVDDTRLRHLVRMVENLKVTSVLNKAPGALLPFVYDIKQCMRANPATASRTSRTWLVRVVAARGASRCSIMVERAAALVAAMCHDLDHPGLSNTFQNNENSELSQRATASRRWKTLLAVFGARRSTAFDGMDVKVVARFQEVVQGTVLATDMARHGALMERIKQKLAEPAWHPLQTPEGIERCCRSLKCADIRTRPGRGASKWNDAVYAEFTTRAI